MQTQTSPQPHRTRAQVLRDRVVVDLALDDVGPEIGKLLAENGIDLPGGWEKVFPHWLTACVDGKLIGCVQVMPVRPVGRCEFLCVKQSAPFKLRAIAVRKLIAAAMSTCHMAGCAYVAGLVGGENGKFEGVLRNLNFVPVSDFRMLAKRLR